MFKIGYHNSPSIREWVSLKIDIPLNKRLLYLPLTNNAKALEMMTGRIWTGKACTIRHLVKMVQNAFLESTSFVNAQFCPVA